jgi:hypothetical protein
MRTAASFWLSWQPGSYQWLLFSLYGGSDISGMTVINPGSLLDFPGTAAILCNFCH